MDVIRENLPVKMIRPDMNGIPAYPLPEAYSIRAYMPGDANAWVELQEQADKFNRINLDLFHKSFGHDQDLLSQRMIFLLNPEGKIIGTAAAWFDNDYHGEKYGRIHWLAVHPGYQGKGLSKPLLSAVCNKLAASGHNKCYLTTSSARIAAINLYLKFGFMPEIISTDDKNVWNSLKQYCNF